jgi:hypothetical protein
MMLFLIVFVVARIIFALSNAQSILPVVAFVFGSAVYSRKWGAFCRHLLQLTTLWYFAASSYFWPLCLSVGVLEHVGWRRASSLAATGLLLALRVVFVIGAAVLVVVLVLGALGYASS